MTIPATPEETRLDEPQLDDAKATRKLRHGLISIAILVALVTGLLLAVPGLHGVAHVVTDMQGRWLAVAIVLEVL